MVKFPLLPTVRPRSIHVALVALVVGCGRLMGFEEGRLAPGDEGTCGAAGVGACEPIEPTRGNAGGGGGMSGDDSIEGTSGSASGAASGRGHVSTTGEAGAGGESGIAGASRTGGEGGRGGAGLLDGDSGAAGDSAGVGGAIDGDCRTSADCANADLDCDVVCDRSGITSRCVVVARDDDRDHHGSDQCEAAPGDDCDDTESSVYPLADETCDGLDNDCDGKSDLEEEHLHLSGFTEVLVDARSPADIAWSSEDHVYGVVWSDGPVNSPHFAPLPLAVGFPIEPVEVDSYPSDNFTLAIAAGEQSFAVAWKSDPLVYYATVSTDGTIGTTATRLDAGDSDWGTSDPALTWTGAGSWAAFWTDSRDNAVALYGRLLFPSDAPGEELVMAELGVYPAAATLGDRVAAVWEGSQGSTLRTQTLEIGGTLEVPESAHPVIASNAQVFGVASRVLDKVEFIALGAEGQARCSARVEAEGFVPFDIVPSAHGFVLFSGASKVEALEVSSECRFGRRIVIDEAAAWFVRAASAGDGGFAVVWGGDVATKLRKFGPNFCD